MCNLLLENIALLGERAGGEKSFSPFFFYIKIAARKVLSSLERESSVLRLRASEQASGVCV